ncbi:sulfite oxidase [Streptomyces sp. PT12]|uniref:sulfite oxidase n=1 Tax=Streptomyces sp. PT12 TaxID=1510197 RepID=UPI000DE22E83|nr:sulfite oxidase [Streptomyces sp. PT12]RBM20765.1 sulfite oxidase [Streptomyces sp. PT12]
MTTDERAYDRVRRGQWRSGIARAEGIDRRDLLRLLAAAGALTAVGGGAAHAAGAADDPDPAPGIVKPLPADQFTVRGTNAETRWSALRGTGYHTPAELFFVRNHTATPAIDADDWRLTLWGDGLRGDAEFGLDDLRALPATERSAFVECAGNGRSHYTTQQGETVSGTAWTLGAIGVARWRGVRLSEVLRRAGLRRDAVDVMPRGLDADFVSGGVNLGGIRRPLPLAKALDDVLLAYEMNGEPLPPDHGHPVRVLVPSWAGIASIKWVGDIEVSRQPLYSPWNTDLYRLFGPDFPPEGSEPLTRQTVKSAFELDAGASFAAHRTHRLTGRSWSGGGSVRRVEISTDGGAGWRRVRLLDAPREGGWVRWSAEWTPTEPGPAELLARATDSAGTTQPERSVFNEQGYLFGAVVRHPVTVTA